MPKNEVIPWKGVQLSIKGHLHQQIGKHMLFIYPFGWCHWIKKVPTQIQKIFLSKFQNGVHQNIFCITIVNSKKSHFFSVNKCNWDYFRIFQVSQNNISLEKCKKHTCCNKITWAPLQDCRKNHRWKKIIFPNINHLTFDESSAYEGDLNHSQRGDYNNNATKILNYWETE